MLPLRSAARPPAPLHGRFSSSWNRKSPSEVAQEFPAETPVGGEVWHRLRDESRRRRRRRRKACGAPSAERAPSGRRPRSVLGACPAAAGCRRAPFWPWSCAAPAIVTRRVVRPLCVRSSPSCGSARIVGVCFSLHTLCYPGREEGGAVCPGALLLPLPTPGCARRGSLCPRLSSSSSSSFSAYPRGSGRAGAVVTL